jgi:hypothetical protein
MVTFSPNGHVAYAVKKGPTWQVISDLPSPPPVSAVLPPGPIFSRDSRHLAYTSRTDTIVQVLDQGQPDEIARMVSKTNSIFKVVVDGVPGPTFETILAGPVVCNDGRLEYVALANKGGDHSLVRVDVPGFSPPSK